MYVMVSENRDKTVRRWKGRDEVWDMICLGRSNDMNIDNTR